MGYPAPKIDYGLLSEALVHYTDLGYEYVEAPWHVPLEQIRATLPAKGTRPPFQLAIEDEVGFCAGVCSPFLVGSAEQALIGMELKPGAYCAVTPCFRNESPTSLLYQTGFMKLELFVLTDDPGTEVERVIGDALSVLSELQNNEALIEKVETDEGQDLVLGGIEIGSYGVRSVEGFGSWVYGTGLALPRFSVADALAAVC